MAVSMQMREWAHEGIILCHFQVLRLGHYHQEPSTVFGELFFAGLIFGLYYVGQYFCRKWKKEKSI
jgi:hypothetical protein